MSGAVAIVAVMWAAAMPVTGTTSCPSPAAVERALEALEPRGVVEETGDARAELVDGGAVVRLRLRGADGAVLSEKELPRDGSCESLAETAAVVLSAWRARLRANVPLALEAPPPRPPPPPPVRPVVVAPPPAPPGPPQPAAPGPATASTSRQWEASLGAGLLGSFQEPSLAPAVVLDLRLRQIEAGWGGRLAVAATGAHEQELGPGRVTWRRAEFALGALRRIFPAAGAAGAAGGGSLDAGVDAIAALLSIEGSGFTTAQSQRTWDLGARGGARLGFRSGRVEPWLAAGAAAWLRSQLVDATGLGQQGRLARLELWAGAGLAVLLTDVN